MSEISGEIKGRMEKALESLKREFAGLRTGRASASLLDQISVDAYGSSMPMPQVGTVNAPEPRLLTVQVWDAGLVKSVEKAIRESDLGLNPSVDGNLIRVPMPDLTEERRKELAKVAAKYTEQGRISVRNVRRDGMDALKKEEKDGDISEDEKHRFSDEIQKLTDQFIKNIDEAFKAKEQDIMQV
ncbi:MAG: ribosome recycling factor [bacterium]|nr:ribosome recycling factor [bacterium]